MAVRGGVPGMRTARPPGVCGWARACVIGVVGVRGARVRARGRTAIRAGGQVDLAAGAPPTAPATETRAREAGGLAAGLTHVHDGVAVDWDASAHDGSSLDPGQPVADAPGILLVETALGSRTGTGTGMVLSPDGLAVTNYHVVEDSSEVHVVNRNGYQPKQPFARRTTVGRDGRGPVRVDPGPAPRGAGAVTSHRPNPNSGPGGPRPVDDPAGSGGRREKHPAGAVGGGVKQCVCRAAQRRRLPVVGHHV